MRYGLTESTIESIQRIFKAYPQIERAVLFGSRAKGNYRPNSDIDLTIAGAGISLTLLMKIETEIDDLLLPYKTDLSVYETIGNPDLVEHIDRVGVLFYSKENQDSRD